MKINLPAYFGFEAIGVLMRDMKTDLMFTINEISSSHAELLELAKKDPKKSEMIDQGYEREF